MKIVKLAIAAVVGVVATVILEEPIKRLIHGAKAHNVKPQQSRKAAHALRDFAAAHPDTEGADDEADHSEE